MATSTSLAAVYQGEEGAIERTSNGDHCILAYSSLFSVSSSSSFLNDPKYKSSKLPASLGELKAIEIAQSIIIDQALNARTESFTKILSRTWQNGKIEKHQ